jgi:hypothetical protein
MTHVGGVNRLALAPLIGDGALQSLGPGGGFVGAQSATTTPTVTFTFTGPGSESQAHISTTTLLKYLYIILT